MAEEISGIEELIRLGWYTVFICVIGELMILVQVANMLYMVYAGAAPTITGCGEHVFDAGLGSEALCEQLRFFQGNGTCPLNLRYDFKSVNVEFDYLCQDTRYVKNSISVQMVGVIIGSLFFGQVSSSYGRKPTLVICLLGCTIFSFISAYSSDLILFTVYRSAIGFFNGGLLSTVIVYVIENIPKKDRIWIVGMVISWSPNIALFAAIAYLNGNWKSLAITTAVLTLPALALCLVALESPRWLIQRGRLDDARRTLEKITRLNGRAGTYSSMIDAVIDREREVIRNMEDSRKGFYIHHLFHTRALATYTIVLAYSFMTASIINYGLLFNMEKLYGSIYINTIVLAMIRYSFNIANAIADYTILSYGRRIAQALPLSFACIGFAISLIIAITGFTSQLQMVSRVAILIAFATTSQIYVTNGVVANELFPTQIRTISFAFLQVVGRIGIVIAPQLFFISQYWTAAPYLAMFLCAFVDLIVYLACIPETKNRPLRDRLSIVPETAALTPRDKSGA